MKNRIINSFSNTRRNPWIAFIFSFFLTGLGQTYNCELSKGITFFGLRIMTIIMIIFHTVYKSSESFINFFVYATIVHILIWLFSPIEAALSAKKKVNVNLKKYNSPVFYFLFGIFNISLFVVLVIILSFFITIEKLETRRMNPTLFKDEYIFINKFTDKNLLIGDIVTFKINGEKKLARIIAKERETISIRDNSLYINEKPLNRDILSDYDLDQLKVKNSEDLFCEINSNIKYPIRLNIPNKSSITRKKKSKHNTQNYEEIFIKDNMLFLAYDNRVEEQFYEIIDTSNITGKVIGILYSTSRDSLKSIPFKF